MRNGRTETPNLPWVVDARGLADVLCVPTVTLAQRPEGQRLRAAAPRTHRLRHPPAGAPTTPRETRPSSRRARGWAAAGLYWDGQRHRPFATEGGHADFAPRNRLEAELMEDVAAEKGRVSAERILSGSGLVRDLPLPPRAFRESGAAGAGRALREGGSGRGRLPLRRWTGRTRCASRRSTPSSPPTGPRPGTSPSGCLPPAASSSAGGIAPKNLAAFQRDGLFMTAFLDKGRMRPLLESIPVLVVLNDRAALWGAAHCAAFDES